MQNTDMFLTFWDVFQMVLRNIFNSGVPLDFDFVAVNSLSCGKDDWLRFYVTNVTKRLTDIKE